MSKILCIDFDGTIVKHAFPNIGEPMPGAFETLRELKAAGYKLILWTCREDESFKIAKQYLTAAVDFCKENGVEFDGVNETPKDEEFRPESTPNRKAYAHIYIDDRNFGGFPGWDAIRKVLMFKHTAEVLVKPSADLRGDRELHENHNLGETRKAFERRLREGWFDKYAPADQPGIDIGCQYDPLNQTFRRFDILFGDGDAAEMEGVPSFSFKTVYASHILEHIDKPIKAVKNWWRLVKPGGHMIIMVPHRDLYEKRKTLPSQWNPEHRWFWLPDETEMPCTLSLKDVVMKATDNEAEIVSLKVLNEGYDHSLPANHHPVGEFSVELIARKPAW